MNIGKQSSTSFKTEHYIILKNGILNSFYPSTNKKVGYPPERRKKSEFKKIRKKKYLPIRFFSLHSNGDNIRIGREIQYLQYAGFLVKGKILTEYRNLCLDLVFPN